MTNTMTRRIALGLVTTVATCAFAPAFAAEWPERPITFVVPFPAGGSTDMVARAIAQEAGAKLGQSIVVENRAGATGAIGATAVKRAAPDGYTVLVGSIGVYATNPFLQPQLAYDPLNDFDLLTVAVRAPNVLVAAPGYPANTVGELVARMKKTPDKITFANSGAGSSDHLTAALMWQKIGVNGVHLPYRGGAPAVNDLMGGHVDLSFQNINAVIGQIQGEKLRALAITGDARSPLLPNVPTLKEAGIDGVDVTSWQAFAAPKGLPEPVKTRLQKVIVDALNSTKVRSRFEELGFEIVANSPDQFRAFLQIELTRWKEVISKGNITVSN